MAEDDTHSIDPVTGRITIHKAGTYRISAPLVNATAGEVITVEKVDAFYADMAKKRSAWVGGPKDGQPVTQADMDTIAEALRAAVLVPDAVRRIAELEGALHALVDVEPISENGYGWKVCHHCGAIELEPGTFPHRSDCPWVRARGLLSSTTRGATTDSPTPTPPDDGSAAHV